MKNTKKYCVIAGCIIAVFISFVGVHVRSMESSSETTKVSSFSEMVWIQTSDGQIIEMPLWYVDQMKVLQMLFLHQKGKNSKHNPLDASQIITSEQLTLLQMAFKNVIDQKKLELFCDNLTAEEKRNLINSAFKVEALGPASLLMENLFSPEIQMKLGASVIQPAGVIAPVVDYLKTQIIRKKKELKGHLEVIECVAYSPNAQYIISGSSGENMNLILWDGRTGDQIKVLEGHTQAVYCVAYSPDGELLVSGSIGENMNLILWDGRTGDRIKVLEGHTQAVHCVAYSPDGNLLISGSIGENMNLILWNGKTGDQIKILKGHAQSIYCVAYSPDGNYIVSGSRDNNLILWDGRTGDQIKILEGHTQAVSCVAYSPDGKYIVSGSYDNNLILWDGKTGEKIKILEGHRKWVSGVKYSPNGMYIVSQACGYDNLVLWNGKTGDRLKVLTGHNGCVNCVEYSADGKYIVSGSNGNVILWDGKTGNQLQILKGHRPGTNCVAYSPDTNYIVSGDAYGNLILWKFNTQLLNFIATQLDIAQARLLYRLYLAKINDVSVVLDTKDLDYQTYLTFPDEVQDFIKQYLPFKESGIFVKEKAVSDEKAIQEKINYYKSLFKKTAASLDEKIKTLNNIMKDLNKDSIDYKAAERLLRELEQEAAFEI